MSKPIALLSLLLAACGPELDATVLAGSRPPPLGPRPPIPSRVSPRSAGAFASAAPAAGASAPLGVASPAATFVWAHPALARAPSARLRPPSVEGRAREHLASFASSYRELPRPAGLELRDVHDTGRGAIIARFGRRIEGIEVFGEQLAVAMQRDLAAVALSGNASAAAVVPGPALAGPSSSRFTLRPERAVALAIAELTQVELDMADVGAAAPASGGYQSVALGSRALAQLGASGPLEPLRVKRQLFPGAAKQLLPAYYVEADLGVDAEGAPRYFAVVLSATDGRVLWKRDLTAYDAYAYRVYADDDDLFMPWDSPQGTGATPYPGTGSEPFEAPFVPTNRVSLSSLEVVGVADPWLAPGASETNGNNVDAYLDITRPSGLTQGSDFRGQVSEPGVFGLPYDPALDADVDAAQRTGAVTQLFYSINWLHDWYYAAGFTEAAGNAQASNYGRGGVEGDAIRAEAQDVNGKNNANMSSPADGASPRMQMYLWDFGPSSLTVTGPAAAAGTYTTAAAVFAPRKFELSGELVRADPVTGCTPLEGSYEGKIVLMDRGGEGCPNNGSFALKARLAQEAGAIGVLIANVASSANPTRAPTPGGTPEVPITIAVLSLNLADGDRLRAALDAGSELEGALARDSSLRDGDVDNQIVAHEWGHYISNRLIGNSSGLGNTMGNSMGEGWGDFHALLMTVRAEDTDTPANESWNGAYAMAAYAAAASSNDPHYFGIRRFPYSTDLTKNPLTFRHLSNDAALPDDVPRSFDGNHAEVHNAGEVWASMLWECYASLLRDTLGGSARLSFAEARDRMRDYVVASYKLTPANPTLTEARDALLAAALASDPVDFANFSQAFAKRGAGVFAVAPDRFDSSNGGIVESYAYGPALLATSARLLDDVSAVCAPDGILDDAETGTLRVTFQNVGTAPSGVVSATVSTSTEGISFPDGPTIRIPTAAIFGSAEGALRVAARGLPALSALDVTIVVEDAGAGEPPPSSYGFLGNADELPRRSRTDGAESSHVVWTATASSDAVPAEARWQRAAVSATEHVYHAAPPASPALIDFQSPALEVLPGEPLVLSFRHRYSFETAGGVYFDGGLLETSSDGGATWNDVGSEIAGYNGTISAQSQSPLGDRAALVGSSPGYPEYRAATLDLGTGFGGSSVLVRFRVGSDAGGASLGWELDDISVSGISNRPFDELAAHSASCIAALPP